MKYFICEPGAQDSHISCTYGLMYMFVSLKERSSHMDLGSFVIFALEKASAQFFTSSKHEELTLDIQVNFSSLISWIWQSGLHQLVDQLHLQAFSTEFKASSMRLQALPSFPYPFPVYKHWRLFNLIKLLQNFNYSHLPCNNYTCLYFKMHLKHRIPMCLVSLYNWDPDICIQVHLHCLLSNMNWPNS